MSVLKRFWPYILIIFVVLVFFYPVFRNNIPFPGDLLVSEYNPWKSDTFLGYNPGSYPNKGQYFDVIREIYPWKTLTIELFKSGQFPLWNPYNFSGSPLFANTQSQVLYPLSILYFVFSQNLAWTILIILQPLLTSFFTYLFTRKIGFSKTAAIFSALTFSFSSFLNIWLEFNTIGQVIIWLPLALLALENLLIKKSRLWSLIFIFSLVSASFGGHIQVFGYEVMFIFVYALFRAFTVLSKQQRKKFLFYTGIMFLLAIGISSIQIVPTLELVKNAARSAHTFSEMFEKILIQPHQLIMFFVPDFFGNPATRNYWLQDTYIGKMTSIGIVPLFFVFLSFAKWKNKLIRFFIITFLFSLIAISANPFTYFLYQFQIPFFSSSSPTLLTFLLCFSLSLLAGFGIDIFKKEKTLSKSTIFSLGFLIIVFLCLWISIFLLPRIIDTQWVDNLLISKRNLLYSTAVLCLSIVVIIFAAYKKKLMEILIVVLLLIQLADAFKSFHKFNPFSPEQFMYPQNDVLTYLKDNSKIDRFYSFGSALIESNIATQYKIFSPEGIDPLYPKWYGEFAQSSKDGNIETDFNTLTRSDVNIYPGFNEENNKRINVLNLLGVKYIIDRKENITTQNVFNSNLYKKVYENNGWKIYENNAALPRFFLTSNYKTYSSPEEFSKIFFANNFTDYKTILLEKNLKQNLEPLDKTDKIELIDYKANSIKFTSNTKKTSLLFLSDTYYPGWIAEIDGKQTQIYKADYAFRAIVVPKGEHEISFTFKSSSFKIGYTLSLISLLIVFFILVKPYDKKSNKK